METAYEPLPLCLQDIVRRAANRLQMFPAQPSQPWQAEQTYKEIWAVVSMSIECYGSLHGGGFNISSLWEVDVSDN